MSEETIERLAALEHEQWIQWSKSLVKTEKLSEDRVLRWQKLWVPYEDLSEKQKEQDRTWVYKVLEVIRK